MGNYNFKSKIKENDYKAGIEFDTKKNKYIIDYSKGAPVLNLVKR